MIEFPSSPADGQAFAPFGGLGYKYSAAKGTWLRPHGTAVRWNRVANGAMRISQQNGDTASGVADFFPADQWKVTGPGSTYQTWGRVAEWTPGGSPYRLRSTVILDYGNVNTFITQDFEGNRIHDLAYGLAGGMRSVLRVGIRAPAGTYGIGLQGAGNTRSIAFPIVVTAPNAGVDQEYVFSVPPITTGAWVNSNAKAISLIVSYSALASWQSSTPGVWDIADANKIAPVGISNNGVAGQTFDVFDVGWHLDPYKTGVAPPFEVNLYEDDLDDCRHYWYKMYGGRGIAHSAPRTAYVGGPHPVPIRSAGSVALVGATLRAYDAATAPNITSVTGSSANVFGSNINAYATSFVAGRAAGVLVDTQTAQYIAYSSRL